MEGSALDEEVKTERIIGEYSQGYKGPLLIITAGIHGNEPSGVLALKNIFEDLKQQQPYISGTFIGIAGNLNALYAKKRFIDEDLNRVWLKNKMDQPPATNEEKEMQDIRKTLKKYREADFEKRYFIDCHTTSAESLPFISVHDIEHSDAWAHEFPVYVVRGFSTLIQGSIDDYFSKNNFTGFTFEAGEHDDLSSVENQEAMIWLALAKINHLKIENINCYPHCVEVLSKNMVEGRRTFEIVYRHELKSTDDFKMKPGMVNFQKIGRDEYIANKNGEKVLSPYSGRIFMPLYQSQGDDGFFIVQEVEKDDVIASVQIDND